MAAVVHKEKIPRLSGSQQIGQSPADVLARGLGVGVIGVDQHRDVVLGESVAVYEAPVRLLDIVNATLELRLRSWVVASYQHRLLCHDLIENTNDFFFLLFVFDGL